MKQLFYFISVSIFFAVSAHCAIAQSSNITGPVGSGRFGTTVTVLTNGNYVVCDPLFDDGAVTDVGAVYLYNGSTHALISTLKGSTTGNQVGSNGAVALPNGNYVVRSPLWDNGAVLNTGAATWCNGTTGLNAVVSSSNSLVGSATNDNISGSGITVLGNGNYLVRSVGWNNGAATLAGAVTWCNGATGRTGVVTSSNSLVGSTAGDNIGGSNVVALTNDNYVVYSPFWNNGAVVNAGAATWGNGSTGITGVISSTNSLVGSSNNDQVGGGGAGLSNGNYLVRATAWTNGAAVNAGALTWCNGTTGRTGVVSSINSLVGSSSNDAIGDFILLSNGNYVTKAVNWKNGAATGAGAVTWCNGTTGLAGVVSSSNSLVGSITNDGVGSSLTALNNGNYVVGSPSWDNGAVVDVGAATWCSGTTGRTGLITSGNSLVGGVTGDQVGFNGITGLSNGHYVVSSRNWDNGAVVDAGAATWCSGTTGRTGLITSGNSLVGGNTNDLVGSVGSVALTNGNYVVCSNSWNNGAVSNAGAATWCNGTTGRTGLVSTSNSLVGSTASDNVGVGGAVALSNGNYIVSSRVWDNGAANEAGAATWGNGNTGTTGVVSSSNSLVGSTAFDLLGNRITALANGNYVVNVPTWDNGAIVDAGAAIWGNGSTGTSGVVSSSNALIGSTANDRVSDGSNGGITTVANGDYVVSTYFSDNGAVTNVGAVTPGNGSAGVSGIITTCNSVIGNSSGNGDKITFVYNSVYDYLIVNRPFENIVSIFNPTSIALANSLDAVTVNINGTNAIPLIASGGCRLIATLTPNGGASAIKNNVTAKVWIEAAVPVFAVLPFVARHYEILPAANAATATGRVTLYFTQQEFTDFNAHPGSFWNLPANPSDAVGKGHLRVARYNGTSSNGSGLPGTYTPGAIVIDPNDADIVWNSVLSRWEISFDATGFGGFIVQTAVYPLAVSFELAGRLENSNALLNWRTVNETNINSFVLERSIDGSNYSPVYQVTAFNTTGPHQYSFTDRNINTLNSSVVYYRIKQANADGSVGYSQVVALSPQGKNIVLLYPNPVQHKANVTITVNDPQPINFRIVDNTGRVVLEQKRTLKAGSNRLDVDVSRLSKGMYWLELKGETVNERKPFVKQ